MVQGSELQIKYPYPNENNKNDGTQNPGFDENGKYWYVYFFYQRWSTVLNKNEGRIYFNFSCPNGASKGGPTYRSRKTLEANGWKYTIKLYENQQVTIQMSDRDPKIKSIIYPNTHKYDRVYSQKITITWDDIKDLIPLNKTLMVWGTGHVWEEKSGMELFYVSDYKGRGSGDKPGAAEGPYCNPGYERGQCWRLEPIKVVDINHDHFVNGSLADKEGNLIYFQPGSAGCHPQSFSDWCYTTDEMKSTICKENEEAFHNETSQEKLCNNKEHVSTPECKSFCSPDKASSPCEKGLEEYCKNETLETLLEDSEKRKLCSCFLSSDEYDKITKVFTDAGYPAQNFNNPRCYYPFCATSKFQSNLNECPDITTCINTINIETMNAGTIEEINKCASTDNPEDELSCSDNRDEQTCTSKNDCLWADKKCKDKDEGKDKIIWIGVGVGIGIIILLLYVKHKWGVPSANTTIVSPMKTS